MEINWDISNINSDGSFKLSFNLEWDKSISLISSFSSTEKKEFDIQPKLNKEGKKNFDIIRRQSFRLSKGLTSNKKIEKEEELNEKENKNND